MRFRPSLLLFVAFAGLIFTSSCTKHYTCHCNIVYTGGPGLPDSTFKEYSIVDTKSGATSKCSAESTDKTTNGIRTVESCNLY